MGQNDGGRKSYESTVMRMAGNIAAGLVSVQDGSRYPPPDVTTAARAVSIARFIVAEVLRTEEKVHTPVDSKNQALSGERS